MEKRRFLLFFIIMILLPSLMFLTNGVFAADHIDLGDAEIFAVLAGTGITNTGFTTITGDVGSSPTPSETGFPGLVTIIDGMNHTAAAPMTRTHKMQSFLCQQPTLTQPERDHRHR